jgi:hypothetical protein
MLAAPLLASKERRLRLRLWVQRVEFLHGGSDSPRFFSAPSASQRGHGPQAAAWRSSTIWPSRICTTREAIFATAASWVIITIV